MWCLAARTLQVVPLRVVTTFLTTCIAAEAEHNVLLRTDKAEEALAILDPPLTEKGRRQVEALRSLNTLAPGCLEVAAPTGSTPAHAAAMKGHVEALRCLHELVPGCLEVADTNGRTPAHVAAAEVHVGHDFTGGTVARDFAGCCLSSCLGPGDRGTRLRRLPPGRPPRPR